MKVGISCLVLPHDWSFAQAIREAKKAGYEAMEVVIREHGELSLDSTEQQLRQLAATAQQEEVYLCSACPSVPNPGLTAADPQARSISFDLFRRLIDIVAGMEIDTMLVVPGSVTADVAYDEAYYRALEGLQRLAPHAEAAGVNLAVEYVWNKFLLSPLEMAAFLDEVGSSRVGFFFDTGNMVIFGYPEQWARICGRHLMKVHFKDFAREGYRWTPLGEGDVNFSAVMAELRRLGYDDALISEVDTATAPLAESAAAIRRIMES
ncbi:MAG: sugar phosphate isomerase/epimerase [Armatimonadetes bacterium]|nr:sugar phosphate isomerase/epimerase [Armatimonadota bacterium]